MDLCCKQIVDSMKTTVKLEVIHDKDTGLTMFLFSWRDDVSGYQTMELANRPANYRGVNDHGCPAFTVLPYDEEIDGAIGESKRAALEASLNK